MPHKAKEEVSNTGSDVISAIQEAFSDSVETGHKFLADLAEEAGDKLTEVQKAFKSGSKQSVKMVKKYPVEAVLLGAGVGLIAGLLLSRRR